MRVVTQQEFGGPEVLRVVEADRPVPGPTEVLVRVKAAGINPVDWKTRAFETFIGTPPFTLGWDVAGVVEDAGRGATGVAIGDEVTVLSFEGSFAKVRRADGTEALLQLQDYSVQGMSRRLGPDYAFYHPAGKAEKFPEIWKAPTKLDPGGRPYQIGGPWTKDAGDFSSTQGQVLSVPDPGSFPVDRVTILEWSNGTFSERPEAPWHGGFRPEPASKNWEATPASWPAMR